MANAHIGAWATRTVGYILVITTVLLVVSIGKELVDGVTLSTNKWGPRTTYTLVSDPFKYWASVVSHAAVALVIGGLSLGTFWLARLEAQVNEPQKKVSRESNPL
ncbi:hypothetical protein GIR22_24650 [Pseudomonas sp. CCM 7891]|uniref:Uncharacterized protein n=1 Tax=Pseudomonas karstica TaxID=1055468 RepID=A0A7X2RWV2_9PSED|nr:hypothetical protein [Pseudomonas karstica]MTD22324.1 hypothetical protein [Pseudomonas karstica]